MFIQAWLIISPTLQIFILTVTVQSGLMLRVGQMNKQTQQIPYYYYYIVFRILRRSQGSSRNIQTTNFDLMRKSFVNHQALA